jgi:hypothetical protein
MRRTILALISTLLTCTTLAAVPPMSEGTLQKYATAVVVGTVVSVHATEERRNEHWADELYEITVAVETVENGVGVQRGLPVIAHGWRTLERPVGWAGPVGIYAIEDAKIGVKLRLYLVDYKGTMNVISPNGLVLLDPPASK